MTDTTTTTTGTDTSVTVTDTTATTTTGTDTSVTVTDTTATTTTSTATTSTATATTRTLRDEDIDFVSYPATIEAVGQFHVSIRYSTQLIPGIARLMVVFTGTQSEDPRSSDYERISKNGQTLPDQQGYVVVTIQTTQRYAFYRLLAYVVPVSDTRWEARYSNRSLGPAEIQAVATTTTTVTTTTKTSTSATDTSVTTKAPPDTTPSPTIPAPDYGDRQCAGTVLRMVLTVDTAGTDAYYSQDAVGEAAAMSIYWRLKIRLPSQAVPCVTPVLYGQGYQLGVRFHPGNDAELCAALQDSFELTDAANKYTITSPPDLTLAMASVEFLHCSHPGHPAADGSSIVTIGSADTDLSGGADGKDGEDYSGVSTTTILIILFGVLLCFAMVALHQMWRRTVDVEDQAERRKMRKQLRMKQEHGIWSAAPGGNFPMGMTSPAMPNMVGPVQNNPLSPANSVLNGYIGIDGGHMQAMSPLHARVNSPLTGHGGYIPINSPLVPMSNGGFMPAGSAYNGSRVSSPMARPPALRNEEDGAWDDAINSYNSQHSAKDPNGDPIYDRSSFHGREITEPIYDRSGNTGPVYDVGGHSGQHARARPEPAYARSTVTHPKPEYAKVTKYHDPDDEPVYETAMTFIDAEADTDSHGNAIYEKATHGHGDAIYEKATHGHGDAIYEKATHGRGDAIYEKAMHDQDDSIYASATRNRGGDIYERATRLSHGNGSNLGAQGDGGARGGDDNSHPNKASKFKRANSVFLAGHNDDDGDNETVCDDTEEQGEAPGFHCHIANDHRRHDDPYTMGMPDGNRNSGGRKPVEHAEYYEFGTKPKPKGKR